MDDIDVMLAGMQRELEEEQDEVRALGDRLAGGENRVRAELNAAIRREDQLRSDIFALKREYQRFTQRELARQKGCSCCCDPGPGKKSSREDVLASQRKLAHLEMQGMTHLSALSDDAVDLLALAWDHPTGAIEPVAEMRGSSRADAPAMPDPGHWLSPARWRAAVGLLVDFDLAERLRGRHDDVELTWHGYRIAGMIHHGARPPKP
jgi:hypothetical protein